MPATVSVEFVATSAARTLVRIREIGVPPVVSGPTVRLIEFEIEPRNGGEIVRGHVTWEAWVSGLRFLVESGVVPIVDIALGREFGGDADAGKRASDFSSGQVALARAQGVDQPHVLEMIKHHSAVGFYVGHFSGADIARRGRR